MYRQYRYQENRIARYFRKTWKNKLFAIALIGGTYLCAKLTGDGTAFVFALFLGLPMFFARSNWIVD